MDTRELEKICLETRKDIINMVGHASSGHVGGSLSAVEMMVATYFDQMKVDPKDPYNNERDRFILSKGHISPCFYSVLSQKGFFPREELKNFRQLGSSLQGHPDCRKVAGVDASTGSLGQGISIAVGMALGLKHQKLDSQVFSLLGDGELQEGQVWEAFMAASHYGLDNLTILIDNNGLQIDGSNDQVMSLGDLKAKCQSFGLEVTVIEDGNNMDQVLKALRQDKKEGKPRCLIAKTIKGKGVSFMENQVGWHGKAPSEEERKRAIEELEASYE